MKILRVLKRIGGILARIVRIDAPSVALAYNTRQLERATSKMGTLTTSINSR